MDKVAAYVTTEVKAFIYVQKLDEVTYLQTAKLLN